MIGKKYKKTGLKCSPQVLELIQIMREIASEGSQDTVKLKKIMQLYGELDPDQKVELYQAMLVQLEIPKEHIEPVMRDILALDQSDSGYGELLSELRSRCHSPRLKLFKQFVNVAGGLKFILDFRGDLLFSRRKADLDISPLDSDIIYVLDSWFQDGFLFLEEISLDSSYRQINIIKEHDMVHPMTGLEEMSRRLGKDRLCFALYHRLMPQEPIIFIEVALTRGIAGSITEIIRTEEFHDEQGAEVDTAMFYSINNTQNGLTGIGLGKILIGHVVDHIKKGHPHVKNFSTLSPLPGFWNRYLKQILQGKDNTFVLKKNDLPKFFPKKNQETLLVEFKRPGHEGICDVLLEALQDHDWPKNHSFRDLIKKPVADIAYHYVTVEKDGRGSPLNPVANFHISNGAQVSRNCIKFLANPGPRGLEESCGVMVNYIYSQHWLTQLKRSISWIRI